MPAACLYAPVSFVQSNPATVQALTNAMVRADRWIQAAGPGDVIKVVPENYLLGDRAIYIDGFLAAQKALSPDGMIPPPVLRPPSARWPAWTRKLLPPNSISTRSIPTNS